MDHTAERPTTDELLRVIADETRRAVLWYLMENSNRQVGVDELVEELRDLQPAPPDERPQLVLELHHVHLPKLDDADIVDYDGESVHYHGQERVEQLLWFIADDLEGQVIPR